MDEFAIENPSNIVGHKFARLIPLDKENERYIEGVLPPLIPSCRLTANSVLLILRWVAAPKETMSSCGRDLQSCLSGVEIIALQQVSVCLKLRRTRMIV